MAWMVENALLLAAVTLLVAVGSLPAPSRRLPKLAFPVLLGALLAGAALFSFGIERSSYVPDSRTSTTLKYALGQIEDSRERNLLLLDGGSYVQKAVDGRLLTSKLREYGFSVRVVRLALSAANHFERYQLYHDLLAALPPQAHPGQSWIFLAETQLGYDTQPLAQFRGNQYSIRALHYLTPSNAYYALAAYQDPQLEPPSEGPWRWDLFRHALINAFNVGVTDRLTPLEEVEAERGTVPRSRRRLYKRVRLEPLLQEIRRPTPNRKPPVWLRRIRERRLAKLWGDRLDGWVYLAVPSTDPAQLVHARSFCRSTRRKCIAPTDRRLIKQLKSRRKWLDASHLSREGARTYTLWLAARLVEAGVLRK